MKLAVIVSCNNSYVQYAEGALNKFCSVNPEYTPFIIGTSFDKTINIQKITVDLSAAFPYLNKRPYGRQYPIECFYHLYAYKLLPEYDYIVSIEPDMIAHQPLSLDFEQIRYVAGVTDGNLIQNFEPIMSHLHRIRNGLHPTPNITQERVRGGLRVYNVSGCREIDFFDRIETIYKKSWEIGAPRCGDDSLFVLYQMIYPDTVHHLDRHYMIIDQYSDYDAICLYHDGSDAKWWNNKTSPSKIAAYFKTLMKAFIQSKSAESSL